MIRKKFGTRAKKLQLESLEGRWLMAGDVSANVIGGNLFIIGDDLSNHISVSDGPNAGEVVITGLPDGNAVATTVGGQPTVTKTGVTQNIVIVLRGGEDILDLNDLTVAKNLGVSMDDGDDEVNVGTGVAVTIVANPNLVTVGSNALIATGTGEDTINIASLEVTGSLGIQAGTEDDHVHLGLVNLSVSNNLVNGDVVKARDLVINLGLGDDELTASHVGIKRAIGIAGAGGDTVNLDHVKANHVAIALLGGEDHVTIKHLTAVNLGIFTGGDNDEVTIEDSSFKRLAVELLHGNDTFSIKNTHADLAVFDGGGGTDDTYNGLGGNSFGSAIRRRFETVNF